MDNLCNLRNTRLAHVRASFLSQFSTLLTDAAVSAILIDHDLREITNWLEEQDMQHEERANHAREGAREIAAAHADADPLVQTSSSIPRQRLTRRELARRRRQRLLELLQHQGKQPASQ